MKQGSLWLDEQCVVVDVLRTQKMWQRLVGLLGRQSLNEGAGLLISPCNAVHTLGMRFALDLVFLDASWRIVRTVANVPPGRLSVWGGWSARHTLEVQAGWLDLNGLINRVFEWRSQPL